MTPNLQEMVEALRRSYPDLEVEGATLNTDGQNSDVVTIKDKWIFRFPKYEHVIEEMKRETTLLSALREYLPLAIPEPRFLNLDAPPGQASMGYRYIPGEPLWRESFQGITSEGVIDHLADQLGKFLGALHSLSQPDLPGIQLGTSDSLEHYQDFYQRIRQKLFSLMRAEACQWAERHFENHLADEANFAYQPTLRHGDFGTSNLLYDEAQGSLTGVLDFSGTALGDPAVDFAGLQISYGEAFVQRIGRTYTLSDEFMQRVRFHLVTFALEEALFGYENGDQAALEAGLEEYI